MSLYDFIPEGRENAIPKAQLSEIFGLSDRALRQAIANERRRGAIILTDCGGTRGYYRPANSGDALRFIKSMRRRARAIVAIADATEQALMRDAGQGSFEGW